VAGLFWVVLHALHSQSALGRSLHCSWVVDVPAANAPPVAEHSSRQGRAPAAYRKLLVFLVWRCVRRDVSSGARDKCGGFGEQQKDGNLAAYAYLLEASDNKITLPRRRRHLREKERSANHSHRARGVGGGGGVSSTLTRALLAGYPLRSVRIRVRYSLSSSNRLNLTKQISSSTHKGTHCC
jgi:hypothetical protein